MPKIMLSTIARHFRQRWLALSLVFTLFGLFACSAKSSDSSTDRVDPEEAGGGNSTTSEEAGVTVETPAREAGTDQEMRADADSPEMPREPDAGMSAPESTGTPDASLPEPDPIPAPISHPPPTSNVTPEPSTPSTVEVPPAPATWNCLDMVYGDGTCDCGCGAPDPDCGGRTDAAVCTRCGLSGSCNVGSCPGVLDLDNNAVCRDVPEDWTCIRQLYADGLTCHCGCGVPDPDCDDSTIQACDVCDSGGACAGGTCPSSIDPEDNAQCSVPEGWSCPVDAYADGLCHCGCGALDPDCDSSSVEDCAVCWQGCSEEACPGPIDAEDNTICTGVPRAWTCEARFFGDGVLCHCGCGAMDPDCAANDVAACDACNFDGSCSVQDCPGTIDPTDVAHCARPDPPPEWECGDHLYADGYGCDCGCGAVDLDCVDDGIDTCDTCHCSYYYAECPNRIDPDDTTRCIPPPEGWTCSPGAYADGYTCHCGCGVVDPDCASEAATACHYCPDASCSESDCSDVSPQNNAGCIGDAPDDWTCDPAFYADGACDCECGVTDYDCEDGATCVFCGGAPCAASP